MGKPNWAGANALPLVGASGGVSVGASAGAAIAPAEQTSGQSEKLRLDRARWREEAYKRVCAGIYKVYHEEFFQYVPWTPPVWLQGFVRDLYATDRHLTLSTKGRQIFLTSTLGVIMLDTALFTPGSFFLVHNVNQTAAKDTLATRLAQPLRATYGKMADDPRYFSIADYHIEIRRPGELGGDTMIRGGESTGRGQTPLMTIATEFPVQCKTNPKQAREFVDGTISGGQHGNHHLEGTVKDISGAPVISEIMETARERQARGYKASKDDFNYYFFGWHCKPGNSLPDDQWDSRRKFPPELNDYFAKLQKPDMEWQDGRFIRRGPIPLTEGQKRWYYVKWANEKTRDMLKMFEDYPSYPAEGAEIPNEANYCRPLLRAADTEGRISEDYNFARGVPVHIFTDWGWDDETVCVFMQPAGEEKWLVLGGFAAHNWTMDAIEARLREQDWEAKTGRRLIIHLPHDAYHKRAGHARHITEQEETSIEDSLLERGFCVGMRMPKPKKQSETFAKVRQAFPRFLFNKSGTNELRQALFHIHIEMLKVDDNPTQARLKKSVHNHWHDALALAARVLCSPFYSGHGRERARETQDFYKRVANGAFGSGLNPYYNWS